MGEIVGLVAAVVWLLTGGWALGSAMSRPPKVSAGDFVWLFTFCLILGPFVAGMELAYRRFNQ